MDTIQVLIHPEEGYQPKNLNVVVLKKFFNQLPQGVEYIRRKPNGDIGIYVSPASVDLFARLKTIETINGIKVNIEIPTEACTFKGVISHPEIKLTSNEDLMELFAEKQVSSVRKLSADTAVIEWPYQAIPEGLPNYIVLGWDTVKVRKFYKRPTRCYFCQKYGHVASSCKKKNPVCCRCATTGHTKDECTASQPKCAACDQEHETTDPSCTKWQQEKKIAKIRQDTRMTYKDALLKLQQENQQHQEEHKQQEEEKQEEMNEDITEVDKQQEEEVHPDDQEMIEDEEDEEDEEATMEEIQELVKDHLAAVTFNQAASTIDTIAAKQRKILRRKVLQFTQKNKLEEPVLDLIMDLVDNHLFTIHLQRQLTEQEQKNLAECRHKGNCCHNKIRQEVFRKPTHQISLL